MQKATFTDPSFDFRFKLESRFASLILELSRAVHMSDVASVVQRTPHLDLGFAVDGGNGDSPGISWVDRSETLAIESLMRTPEFANSLNHIAPLFIDSVEGPEFKSFAPYRALAVIPLYMDGKILGALVIWHTEKVSFDAQTRAEHLYIAEHILCVLQRTRQFEELQKKATQSEELLAIASHEIKTPLTSLKMNVEYLVREQAKGGEAMNDPDRNKCLKAAHQQVKLIQTMVENFMDLTRITHNYFTCSVENVDLSSLLVELCREFQDESQRIGGVLSFDIADGVIARADPLKL